MSLNSGFVAKYTQSNFNKTKEFDVQSFPDDDYDSINSSDSYQKGMKVRHPTFGAGTIYQVEGSGDQQKLSVLFTDQTIKKFVAKYARLERI